MKKIIVKIFFLLLTINIAFFSFTLKTAAQSKLEVAMPSINPTKQQILLPGSNSALENQELQQNFIPQVTMIIIGITGTLALLFVIIAGIQMLTAYGNEEQLEAGKKTLTWALAGFAISIFSYAIVQVIIAINLKP